MFAYDIQFGDDGWAVSVTHLATTDLVQVDSSNDLKVGVKIEGGDDDYTAHYIRPPKQKAPLAVFYCSEGDDKTGPWKMTRYHGPDFKKLKTDENAFVKARQEDVKKVMKLPGQMNEADRKAVSDGLAKKNADIMEEARQAARERMVADEFSTILSSSTKLKQPEEEDQE